MTRRPPPLCWRRRRRRPTRRSSLARTTASRTWRGGRRGTWRGLATTRRRGGTRRWARRPTSGQHLPPRTARMHALQPSSSRRSGGGRTWSEKRALPGSTTPAVASLRPRRLPAIATSPKRRLSPPTTDSKASHLPARREVSPGMTAGLRTTGLGSAPRSRLQWMAPTTEAAGMGVMGRRWPMTMTKRSSCLARRQSCRGDAPLPSEPARLIR